MIDQKLLEDKLEALFNNTTFLQHEIKDLEGQLDGQWQHIRNLEEKLLAPGEKLWTSTKL